jgi:hypothetical protein
MFRVCEYKTKYKIQNLESYSPGMLCYVATLTDFDVTEWAYKNAQLLAVVEIYCVLFNQTFDLNQAYSFIILCNYF